MEKQSVIDHARVVVCQCSKRRACWNEFEIAGDRCFIVHPVSRNVPLAKEDGLVRRYGIGNLSIRHGGIDMAGRVKASEIVPVPGEAPAAQPMLEAVHVCGSRLLPEGPFDLHDSRFSFRKLDVRHVRRRVTEDRDAYAWFASGSRAKLEFHLGTHIGSPIVRRCVADNEIGIVDSDRSTGLDGTQCIR